MLLIERAALWHNNCCYSKNLRPPACLSLAVCTCCEAFNTVLHFRVVLKICMWSSPAAGLSKSRTCYIDVLSAAPRAASSQREYIHSPPGFLVTYQLLVRLSACRPRNPICTECHQRHDTYLQWFSEALSTTSNRVMTCRPLVWDMYWSKTHLFTQ